jgi:hypothetical protein
MIGLENGIENVEMWNLITEEWPKGPKCPTVTFMDILWAWFVQEG